MSSKNTEAQTPEFETRVYTRNIRLGEGDDAATAPLNHNLFHPDSDEYANLFENDEAHLNFIHTALKREYASFVSSQLKSMKEEDEGGDDWFPSAEQVADVQAGLDETFAIAAPARRSGGGRKKTVALTQDAVEGLAADFNIDVDNLDSLASALGINITVAE